MNHLHLNVKEDPALGVQGTLKKKVFKIIENHYKQVE